MMTTMNSTWLLPSFVALLLLCGWRAAHANIDVTPAAIGVGHVRGGTATSAFMVWLTFSGNDTLLNIDVEGGVVAGMVTSRDDSMRLPRGLDGYFSDMCEMPCVSAINSTSIAVTLQHAPYFDLRLDQTLYVVVSSDHFADFTPRYIPILFTSSEAVVSGAAYGMGVPFLIVETVSLLLFPALHDGRTVVAYVSSPCTTVEQTGWLPASTYFLAIFGGGTVFSQAWKFFVACGSLLSALLVLLLVTRSNQVSLLMSRAFVPLVLVQLTCFFTPSLVFDAGFMVSYGYPSHQVFGAFVLLFVAVASVLCFTVWFGDPLRKFQAVVRDDPSMPHPVRFLTRTCGMWFSPRFAFLLVRDADSHWMVFPDRWLLPTYFAEVRRDKIAMLVILHLLCFLLAGIQMTTPTLCFVQACVLSALHFVLAVLVGFYFRFRNIPTQILSALLHLNSSLMLGMLAAFPSGAMFTVFLTGAGIGLVLGLARIVLWGRIVLGLDSVRVAVAADELSPTMPAGVVPGLETRSDDGQYYSSPLLVLEEETDTPTTPSEGGGHHDEGRGLRISEPRGSAVSDEDEDGDADDGASADNSKGDTRRTPQYLLEASVMKPKPRREDRLRIPEPLWFPAERPNVRTTDDPDNELKLAPYRIRKQ